MKCEKVSFTDEMVNCAVVFPLGGDMVLTGRLLYFFIPAFPHESDVVDVCLTDGNQIRRYMAGRCMKGKDRDDVDDC